MRADELLGKVVRERDQADGLLAKVRSERDALARELDWRGSHDCDAVAICQAWADVVQIYGDQLLIDAATRAGLWPEQFASSPEGEKR